MDRTRAVLAAGGMTGLVLATLLALGFPPDGQYQQQIEQANLALQQTRSPAAANPSDGHKYDRDEDESDENDDGSHVKHEDEHEYEHDD